MLTTVQEIVYRETFRGIKLAISFALSYIYILSIFVYVCFFFSVLYPAAFEHNKLNKLNVHSLQKCCLTRWPKVGMLFDAYYVESKKEDELCQLTASQKEQTDQEQKALDDFKLQVENKSAKMYESMKIQVW